MACKSYWADTSGSESCDIDIIKKNPYGFKPSKSVIIAITPAKNVGNNFEATAKHNNSSVTYTIDEEDNINQLGH